MSREFSRQLTCFVCGEGGRSGGWSFIKTTKRLQAKLYTARPPLATVTVRLSGPPPCPALLCHRTLQTRFSAQVTHSSTENSISEVIQLEFECRAGAVGLMSLLSLFAAAASYISWSRTSSLVVHLALLLIVFSMA